MALIVEDGTGLATADAYISVAGFLAYHVKLNNASAILLTTAEIEGAIRYATVWMDGRYEWRGDIVEDDQALNMPTENGEDDQGRDIEALPLRVANACAELSLMHTQKSLNPILGPRVVEQVVDDAVRRRFSDRGGNEGNRYPIIDQMLKGLYTSGGSQYIASMAS